MTSGTKLRYQPLTPAFHIVLVEPEIPPNTGSIARTCAATNTPLHLIEPLGFDISDHAVRRAGLDYWHLVDVRPHPNFAAFEAAFAREAQPGRIHVLSANAHHSYLEADFEPGDAIVFGKESVGLPRELTQRFNARCWAIPTSGGVRSLNLSNAVSIVLYEALRRTGALGRTFSA